MFGGIFRRNEPVGEERAWSMQQLGQMVATTAAATTVTDSDEALRNATVWACVDILAGSASALPIDAVREQGNIRVPVSPTPSLLAAPSAVSTLDVWIYQLMWSLLTDGNAFGMVTMTDGSGRPTAIELLAPSDVRERKFSEGRATVKVGTTEHGLYPYGDIWHVPGKMTPPGSPFALSPLRYAGRVVGTGLAAEAFGSRFFTDGGHPSSIVYSDQTLTQEQAKGIREAFLKASAGTTREPAVFGSGLKYEQIQVSPTDSQFIDLMRFEVEQVCRFWRVPPSMVYGAVSGQAVTYANVSQADLHYLKHSLDGYLVRVERALALLLPRPQTVKFNRDALLRSDTLTRYQAHQIGMDSGFLTADEVREMEDRPPLPDGEGDSPAAHEMDPADAGEDAQEGPDGTPD